MKSILKLIIPAMAVALCLNHSAFAQVDGYRFGVGLGYAGADGNCGRFGFERNLFGLPIAPTPRIDQPPFFALYPPVYYSQDIIARPYGVSPFAAPSGINPIEMGGPFPTHQVNPYFEGPNVPPAEGQVPEAKKPDSTPKTTWIKNPHYDPLASPGDEIAVN